MMNLENSSLHLESSPPIPKITKFHVLFILKSPRSSWKNPDLGWIVHGKIPTWAQAYQPHAIYQVGPVQIRQLAGWAKSSWMATFETWVWTASGSGCRVRVIASWTRVPHVHKSIYISLFRCSSFHFTSLRFTALLHPSRKALRFF